MHTRPPDAPPPSPSRPPLPHEPARRPFTRGKVLRYGLLGLAGLAGLVLLCAAYVLALIPRAPGVEDLKQVQVARPSVLLTADGKTLATFRRQQREPLTLDEVSPHVVNALIATEDRRFYEHRGLDLRRIAGAAWHTLNGDRQGGSTITQQLARNLFPEDIGRARNLDRKLKEMITAVRIERVYSKDEILAQYLNSTPFLYNAVGIEMAARTYFDTSARELDVLQAATLVGMLKGTHYYNPVLFPQRAQQRRNVVLQQMVKTGALQPAEYERLRDRPVQVTLSRQEDTPELAPHFAVQARRWLLDWAERHDIDLYSEGLVIESTLDSRLQAAAEKAVARQGQALQHVADVEWASPGLRLISTSTDSYANLARRVEPFRHFFAERPDLLLAFLRETPEYKQAVQQGADDAQTLKRLRADPKLIERVRERHTRLEAGFVAMDPQTGEVKAWVGSRNFADDQFDHVAQAARQPGSTFKAIVYAAALEAGIGPERSYLDGPVEVALDDRTVWRPTDMGGYTGRLMTLRDGLVYSKNTITAQVSQEVGVERIVALARALGVDRSRLDAVPSIALGTSPVTLYEMVNAYATIAAQGQRHKPLFIRRILDREGEVLAEFVPQTSRALSADTAIDLIDMMRGAVSQGTGAQVKARFNIGADVAGKTGTTQNNADGWFILMHPHLVAGAWVGFNDQRVTMRSDHWGQGGHNALLLVGDFFRETTRGKLLDANVAFPPPRRPPVITTYAPPPDSLDESTGMITDVDGAPISGSGSGSGDIVVSVPADARDGGGTVSTSGTSSAIIGDPAGVEAMRRSTQPPKSAEELDRLFGNWARTAPASSGSSGTAASRLPPPDAPAPAAMPPPDPAKPTSDGPAIPDGTAVPSSRRWIVDSEGWTVSPPGGVAVRLAAKEMRLVSTLAQAAGSTISRDNLRLALGYANTELGEGSLDALIRRVRLKLRVAGAGSSPIQTVHGSGYVFSAPVLVK